jgi:hypothetical protein
VSSVTGATTSTLFDLEQRSGQPWNGWGSCRCWICWSRDGNPIGPCVADRVLLVSFKQIIQTPMIILIQLLALGAIALAAILALSLLQSQPKPPSPQSPRSRRPPSPRWASDATPFSSAVRRSDGNQEDELIQLLGGDRATAQRLIESAGSADRAIVQLLRDRR